MKKQLLLLLTILVGLTFQLSAQTLSTPPNGNNQKASVTQYIGSLVSVTVDYSSPDVTAPNGTDRKGQIWGQLVPYGFTDLGFGNRNPSPWRAGANENTTITFSHDVEVEGKSIEAGTYGLHIAVEEAGPWTLVFSNRNDAWGSFFYEESKDALRVQASPKDTEYTEWLTYEFVDRQPTEATLALKWEEKMLPFKISVPNLNDLYVSTFEEELTGSAGFVWQNWQAAANWSIQNDYALEKGLAWAEQAISAPFFGNENFGTLSTKANVLTQLERADEAKEVMDKALNHPSTTVFQIHQYGRQLIGQGDADGAMEVFKMNAKRFPKTWPINVGLARGYSAKGEYKTALKHAKLAYEAAPDQLNKDALKTAIESLEKGEAM
ncbi:MAG: DUF2911 domain-containing protein [Cyclobacteriaceae bacterium]